MITRLLQLIIVVSLAAIILILANTAASSAHGAVFTETLPHGSGDNSKAISFEQPDLERLFYANLNAPGSVDFYSFQAKAGLSFKAQILIPRLPGLQKFRPALALFGPGLPPPDSISNYEVPFNLPDNNGLVVSISDQTDNDKTNDTLYSKYDESYTQSSFWEGQNLFRQLPQDGTYYIAVFNPNNQTGKYALEVGDRDGTGLKETLAFPVLWFSLHFWFGDWLTPTLVVIGLILLVAVLVVGRWWLRRRKLRRKLKSATPSLPSNLPSKETSETPVESDPTLQAEKKTSEESERVVESAANLESENEASENSEDTPIKTELVGAELEKTESEAEPLTAQSELIAADTAKKDENKKAKRKKTEPELAEFGEDSTFVRWRKGRIKAHLETDFLATPATDDTIKPEEDEKTDAAD